MKRRKNTDLLLSCLNPMPGMEILHSDERVVIVAITHNRREEVLRSLWRHARLPEQPPIIVVDNASVDGTACAVAEQFPRAQVLRSASNLEKIQAVEKGIVLMHDSSEEEAVRARNRTLELTKLIVPILKGRGYRFVRLDSVPQVQRAIRVGKLGDFHPQLK
jgi:hypothetical protein